MYDSSSPRHPYYDVCRHGWWESALREIRGWDKAEQNMFFATQGGGWPEQLPRPAKRADEKVIIAFLRQRLAL